MSSMPRCGKFLALAVALFLSMSSAVAQRAKLAPLGDGPSNASDAAQSDVVPRLVRFNGQLPQLAGRPNQNASATRLVSFAVYAQAQGGAALWSESQIVTFDAAGAYSAMLGATILNGMPSDLFSSGQPRWLGVTVEGEAEQTRILLVSVPYSLQAQEAANLGGHPASEYVTQGELQAALQAMGLSGFAAQPGSSTRQPGGLDDTASGARSVTQQGLTGAGATSFSDTSGNEVVFVNQSGTGMGVNVATTGTVAVNATTSSASGTGVNGAATSTAGTAVGVNGTSASPNGQGVVGSSTSTSSNQTDTPTGVKGQAAAAFGTGVAGTASGANGTGVHGVASSPSGTGIGVLGEAVSPAGTAGLFNVSQPGATILNGTVNGASKFKVDSNGVVTATKFIGDGSALTGIVGGGGGNGIFTSNGSFTVSNGTPGLTITQTGAGVGIVSTSSGAGAAIKGIAAGTGPAGVFQGNGGTILQALGTTGEVFRADDGGIAIGQGQTISQHISATATLQFPQFQQASCSDLPVNVAGVADGDTVSVGVPAALATAPAVQYTGFVSSPGVVTVRACALQAVGALPAATVRVDAWKHSGAPLNGNNTGNILAISPINVVFPTTAVGANSQPVTVSLFNQGAGPSNISLTSIAPATGDFSVGATTCGSTLAPNASCTVNVVFSPTQAGQRTGAVAITDSAPGSPQTIALSGAGSGSSLVVSPASVPFGAIAVGSSSQQTLTVSNIGAGSLTYSHTALSGSFSILSDNCGSSGSLTAGNSCTLVVKFAPSGSGSQNASLTFNDNSGNPPHIIAVSGSGGLSRAALSTTFLSFGTIPIGGSSSPQTVTLSNGGNANLQIGGVNVTGNFAIQSNTCAGSLAPAAACVVSVIASPTSVSVPTGQLTFLDDSQGNPGASQTVQLSVSGSTATAQLSTSSLFFSTVAVTSPVTTSSAQQVSLTNVGSTPLTVNSISINGDFAQTNTCGTLPATLAANASCVINVTFSPTASGSRSGTLTIVDNNNGVPNTSQPVSLNGTGDVPAISVANNLNFPATAQASTASPQAFLVSNRGGAPLNFSAFSPSPTPDFAVQSGGAGACAVGTPLQPRAACTITVAYSPTAAGSVNGNLAITSDSGGLPGTITNAFMSGSGQAQTTVLQTTTNSFAGVSVGATSTPLEVLVQNFGGFPLTISSVALNNPNFAISSDTCGPHYPAQLAPRGSCTIQVTFTPATSGNDSATLTVTDNANGNANSVHAVTLFGSGNPPVGTFDADITSLFSTGLGTPSPASEVLLTNTGGAPLTITQISITGDFTVTQTDCPMSPSSLAPSAVCHIYVQFNATVSSSSATLSVLDNNQGNLSAHQTVFFDGSLSTPGGAPTLNPSNGSPSMSAVGVGVPSTQVEEVITNFGGSDLIVTGIGVSPGQFTIIPQDAVNCPISGTITIHAQKQCTYVLSYTPSVAGGVSGTLVFTSNEGSVPGTIRTIPLSGSVGVPTISLSTTELDFPSSNLGVPSRPQLLQVTNSGAAPLIFTGASISQSGAEFAIDPSSTCTATITLQRSQSCYFIVTFTSSAAGSRNATLTLTDNTGAQPGSTQPVTLFGSGGQPVGSLSTSELDFSNSRIGQTGTPQLFTITNTGAATLTITNIALTGSDFALVPSLASCSVSFPITMAPGTSCSVSVSFTPSASGSRTGTVTITDNNNGTPGSQQTVTLFGNGGTPTASVTSGVNFSTQALNLQSAPLQIQFSNTGNGPMILTAISVTPATEFSETDNCGTLPATLAPGANCVVDVFFTPTASGARNASLTFTDNSGGTPGTQQGVILSGTGGSPSLSFNQTPNTFVTSGGVGVVSDPQQATIANNGSAPLIITSISTTGDFSQTSNCPISPSSLARGQSCSVTVTFTSTALGSRTGSLVVKSNNNGVPNSTSTATLGGFAQ